MATFEQPVRCIFPHGHVVQIKTTRGALEAVVECKKDSFNVVTLLTGAPTESRPDKAAAGEQAVSGSESDEDMDLHKALKIVAEHYSKRNAQLLVNLFPSLESAGCWLPLFATIGLLQL